MCAFIHKLLKDHTVAHALTQPLEACGRESKGQKLECLWVGVKPLKEGKKEEKENLLQILQKLNLSPPEHPCRRDFGRISTPLHSLLLNMTF